LLHHKQEEVGQFHNEFPEMQNDAITEADNDFSVIQNDVASF
jgi:hypothetical protein